MINAYLSVETHAEHPGLVRILLTATSPVTSANAEPSPHVHYVARFNDAEAALMHTHELLRRRLLDIDAHLYRTDLVTAIAALESLDLRHHRVYLDPQTASRYDDDIRRATADLIARRQRREKLFQAMGFVGIVLLLLNLFTFSLA